MTNAQCNRVWLNNSGTIFREWVWEWAVGQLFKPFSDRKAFEYNARKGCNIRYIVDTQAVKAQH